MYIEMYPERGHHGAIAPSMTPTEKQVASMLEAPELEEAGIRRRITLEEALATLACMPDGEILTEPYIMGGYVTLMTRS